MRTRNHLENTKFHFIEKRYAWLVGRRAPMNGFSSFVIPCVYCREC
jgi:hypothetical protein